MPPDTVHTGDVTYSRWSEIPFPQFVKKKCAKVISHHSGYQYNRDEPGSVGWHVNFADAHLFGCYAGPLLAQDEMQVAEHPVLACVRQAAQKEKAKDPTIEPLTHCQGRATPVLIRGAQRRSVISNAIYGNKFAEASDKVVRASVTVLNPPTTSNILAIEAPRRGSGEYTEETIKSILCTFTRYLQQEPL